MGEALKPNGTDRPHCKGSFMGESPCNRGRKAGSHVVVPEIESNADRDEAKVLRERQTV